MSYEHLQLITRNYVLIAVPEFFISFQSVSLGEFLKIWLAIVPSCLMCSWGLFDLLRLPLEIWIIIRITFLVADFNKLNIYKHSSKTELLQNYFWVNHQIPTVDVIHEQNMIVTRTQALWTIKMTKDKH